MDIFDLATYSIRTGAIRLKDLGYLLAAENELEEAEEEHTVIFVWDPAIEKWSETATRLYWTAHSACIVDHPMQQLIAIGVEGDFFMAGQGDNFQASIFDSVKGHRGAGEIIRGVQSVDGGAHVVGWGGAAYRRDDRNSWTRINDGLSSDVRLEAVDGFLSEEIYAVGWDGEIWKYNGSNWQQIDSLTNLVLTNVHCAEDGQVYCTGRSGTLIRGRDTNWQVVAAEETDQDIWDVHWFNGKLYVSTISFLYTLEKSGLVQVEFDCEPPESCYHLSSADGVLWSIGGTDVLAFDGKAWTRIV